MHTVRRLYLFSVAFLSLEVVIWGFIGLLRSILIGNGPVDGADSLAKSLSLLLVGLPVFLLHIGLAQRSASRDSAERSSRVRAIFLFGTMFATLLPALLHFLALVNRALLSFFGADPGQALVGGDQTSLDNLVAILVNLLGAALVLLLLKSDRGKPVLGNALAETRRLYRLIWQVIGVALIVSGLSVVLHFLIGLLGVDEQIPQAGLPNGLSLLLVGIPVWFSAYRQLESSLSEPAEQRSYLRLIMMYFLAFTGLGALLLATGLILEPLLQLLFGAGLTLLELLEEIRLPLSMTIPAGAVWAYYERQLQAERRGETPAAGHKPLHRMYRAVFAFLGLVATFISMYMLLEIGLAYGFTASSPAFVFPGLNLAPTNLATALAFLLLGFPVWLLFWRAMQLEAGDPGEAGDRARLSLVRKAYLYVIVFLGITGLMASMGQLAYQLLQSTLQGQQEGLVQNALPGLKNLLLFAIVLSYHGWVLRRDTRRSERSLAKRRALYPVLLLVPDEGDFADRMVSALEHYLPGLPIAVHPVSSGAPDESLSAAKAVILPFEILAKPPEAVRLWLQSFSGERLVVPSNVDNWHWVAGSRLSVRDPAQRAALVILDRVEGNKA